MRERNTNKGEVAAAANCLMMVRAAVKMEAKKKKKKKSTAEKMENERKKERNKGNVREGMNWGGNERKGKGKWVVEKKKEKK